MLASTTRRPGLRRAARRALTRVAAGAVVTVGASAGLVVMAGAAEAHTGSLTAVAVCVPATGTYTVTYTGVTTRVPDSGTGHVATLTVGDVVPATGTTIAGAPATVTGNTTYTYTQTGVPGSATTAASTAFLVWADGVTSSPRASVMLPGACGQSVTPVSGTVTESVCQPGSTTPTTPTYTIPAVTGVAYQVGNLMKPPGTYEATPGTTVTVTAHALPGYVLATGAQTTWTLSFTPAPDCTKHVDPVQPTVTQSECTGPGTASAAYLTIPSTEGVAFAIDGTPVAAGNHVRPPGTYAVTATALPGYTLAGTSSWTLTIDPPPDCTTHVTPAAAQVTPAVCVGAGTPPPAHITIPASTGVVYTLDGAATAAGRFAVTPGTHVVTATAMPGYTLDGTTTWTFDVLRGPNCVLPLATPLAASAHCESSADSVLATYTIPVRTGVDYFVDGVRTPAGTYRAGSRSVVHVNAVARPGFELVPGVRRAWTFSFASNPDCVLSHDEHERDLPVTGDSTGLLTLAGLSALAAGGSLTAVGSRCRLARCTR